MLTLRVLVIRILISKVYNNFWYFKKNTHQKRLIWPVLNLNLTFSPQITKFGLKLLRGTQFFNDYDETVNAQMTAGFSVAAFRFGHTLIQEWFRRFNQKSFQHKDKSEFRPIPVLDFENPQYLYEICQGGVDAILRGLIKDAAGKADGLVNMHFSFFSKCLQLDKQDSFFFFRDQSLSIDVKS